MLPNPFDDRPERLHAKSLTTLVCLVAANLAVWLWAWIAFAGQPAILGTAFLAYMFGLRHAFDADHIAAIDNVVRKLMQDGKAPAAAGFFFSVGHSTVVVLATIGIAITASALHAAPEGFQALGGFIGTVISSGFLLLIGLANLFILRRIWSAFVRARHGQAIVDEDLDALLSGRGFIARIFRPLFNVVLVPSTPMNDDRLSTAGSCSTIFAISCCRSAIASNEIDCCASVMPWMTPVSCTGKKPLGMTI